MADSILPRVLAMVVCDDVVESDDEIGVFHLTGVRTTVEAASFPTVKVLRAIAQLQMGQADRGRALLAEAMESSPGLNARSWRAANFLSDSKALDAQVADLVSMGLPQ